MKLSFKHILLLIAFCTIAKMTSLKAQDAPLIQSIRIVPLLETYTVSAVNDTSYAYEVELIINDTTAFSSVQIQIAEKTDNDWQAVQTVNRNVPSPSNISCQTPLCIYRRNENVWLIYLGYNSLTKRYKVNLHFNNPVLNDWNCEF